MRSSKLLGCCLKWSEVTQSCPTLCDPMDSKPTRLPRPWDFPGKNTGVGCHFHLQGIFPIQGSNLCLLPWQGDSLPLSHLGSPKGHCRSTATVSVGLLNQGSLFSSFWFSTVLTVPKAQHIFVSISVTFRFPVLISSLHYANSSSSSLAAPAQPCQARGAGHPITIMVSARFSYLTCL